jgi:small subunit ribosomal protein S20
MANTASAKKSIGKNEKRKEVNLARRTAIKTAIKKVLVAIDEGTAPERLDAYLRDVAAKLGRARGKGRMHKNTAARKLGRLAKKVARTKQAEATK